MIHIQEQHLSHEDAAVSGGGGFNTQCRILLRASSPAEREDGVSLRQAAQELVGSVVKDSDRVGLASRVVAGGGGWRGDVHRHTQTRGYMPDYVAFGEDR
jgi:hypothetical protein